MTSPCQYGFVCSTACTGQACPPDGTELGVASVCVSVDGAPVCPSQTRRQIGQRFYTLILSADPSIVCTLSRTVLPATPTTPPGVWAGSPIPKQIIVITGFTQTAQNRPARAIGPTRQCYRPGQDLTSPI